jgi:hypothetical protein
VAPGEGVQDLPRATHRTSLDCIRRHLHAEMNSRELRALLNDILTSTGFSRQDSSTWVKAADGLSWTMELDRSPYGPSYSLDIGGMPPGFRVTNEKMSGFSRAGNCPIMVHLNGLPLPSPSAVRGTRIDGFATAVPIALDLDSELDDEVRREILREGLRELSNYIGSINNIGKLRLHYENGDFASAYIRWDLRELLESASSGQDRFQE